MVWAWPGCGVGLPGWACCVGSGSSTGTHNSWALQDCAVLNGCDMQAIVWLAIHTLELQQKIQASALVAAVICGKILDAVMA